jgi:hypothetical protein
LETRFLYDLFQERQLAIVLRFWTFFSLNSSICSTQSKRVISCFYLATACAYLVYRIRNRSPVGSLFFRNSRSMYTGVHLLALSLSLSCLVPLSAMNYFTLFLKEVKNTLYVGMYSFFSIICPTRYSCFSFQNKKTPKESDIRAALHVFIGVTRTSRHCNGYQSKTSEKGRNLSICV